jgi:hypothetical protein
LHIGVRAITRTWSSNGEPDRVTAAVSLFYSLSWLLLPAVIRCYSIAAATEKRGFPGFVAVRWLFFFVHISQNSGGSGFVGEPR